MDGAASIHFYNSMLSADPGERRAVSPLSVEAYEAYKRQFPPPKKPARPNLTDIKAIGDFLKEQWGNSVGVTKAMNQYLAAMFGVGGDGLATPFAGVPRTSFNQIGRAHVCTPVTHAHLVCRILLEKKKKRYKEYIE